MHISFGLSSFDGHKVITPETTEIMKENDLEVSKTYSPSPAQDAFTPSLRGSDDTNYVSDTISLSTQRPAVEMRETRGEKLNRLRQGIDAGTYAVPSVVVATAMINRGVADANKSSSLWGI